VKVTGALIARADGHGDCSTWVKVTRESLRKDLINPLVRRSIQPEYVEQDARHKLIVVRPEAKVEKVSVRALY